MFIKKNPYTLNHSFNTEFFFKDCSEQYLHKTLDPHLVSHILTIGENLKQEKLYRTYDVGYMTYKIGEKTCVDTGWHCDGINNQYLIYCKGDFRTKILSEESPSFFPQDRSQIRESNQIIASEFAPLSGVEIDDLTPYLYGSSDIHKGRVADKEGARVFLRICESDYLKPKNFNLLGRLRGNSK
jgi:hypothetical protein